MDQSFSVNLKVDQGNVNVTSTKSLLVATTGPLCFRPELKSTSGQFWLRIQLEFCHSSTGLLDFYFLSFHPLTGSSCGWFLVNDPHLLALQYVVLQVLHQLGAVVFVEKEVLLLPGQRRHGSV